MSARTTHDSDYIPMRKAVLIGDYGVGKTSLLNRFGYDRFNNLTPILGVDFSVNYIRLDGKLMKLQLWDNAGWERYRYVPMSSFRDTYGVAVVYDVTNQASFNNVGKWLDQIDTKLYNDANKLLIGNKCDLTTQRVVEYATAKEYADKAGVPLVETSAKDSTNVKQAFIRLVLDIKTRMLEEELEKSRYIKLNQITPSTPFMRGCW